MQGVECRLSYLQVAVLCRSAKTYDSRPSEVSRSGYDFNEVLKRLFARLAVPELLWDEFVDSSISSHTARTPRGIFVEGS